MKRFAQEAVIALSILPLTTSGVAGTNSVRPEIIRPSDRQLLTEAFASNKQYWTGQGVIGAAALKLVLLSGGDTFICQRSNEDAEEAAGKLTARSTNQYCPQENAVVMTAMGINSLNWHAKTQGLGDGSLANSFVVAHEVGHGVQDAIRLLNGSSTTAAAQTTLELQATTFAGEYLSQSMDQTELDLITATLANTKTFAEHGSARQQAEAFMAGVDAHR